MLTLTQAQERLGAYRDLAIDWTRPAEEACRIALAANDLRLRRAEVEAIHETLLAYAAHLSFEEGKAFEVAAVKRSLETKVAHWERGEVEADGQDVRAACAAKASALADFETHLERGLHYAEPVPTPQMGDVWRIGRMVASDAEVRCVHPETGNLTVAGCYGDRTHKVISAEKFTRNRRLVVRDGKAVT